MDEHDDDLESVVHENADEEVDSFPDTGDELDEDLFDDDEEEDEEDEDLDDDSAELRDGIAMSGPSRVGDGTIRFRFRLKLWGCPSNG